MSKFTPINIPDLLAARLQIDETQAKSLFLQHQSQIPIYDDIENDAPQVILHRDGTLRTHMPGHITTSCLIYNHSFTKTLLVLHKKYREWVHLGGHADGDWFWLRSALRECLEETHITDVKVLPSQNALIGHQFGLPCRILLPHFIQTFQIEAFAKTDAHKHFDFVYIFCSSEKGIQCDPNESLDIKWFSVDDIQKSISNQKKIPFLSELSSSILLRGLDFARSNVIL